MNDTTHTPTEPTPTGRRKRRGPRASSTSDIEPSPDSKPCPRDGCPGLIKRSGHDHCSFICRAIALELERTQRVCAALGADTPLVAELWAETVAVSDGWTRHIELDRRLYREARSVGITDEQYRAIKYGWRT